MTTIRTPGWDALAYAVRARRERLGFTQKNVNQRGGPSEATMNKLEQARDTPFKPNTLAKVDKALGWKDGTAHGIVTGDIPGAWLNDFTNDVENVIVGTSGLSPETFSQVEIDHFDQQRGQWQAASVPSEMIDTEATLARLRRARDELTAAIESIQTAAHIARLDKLQQQADSAPLSDIMGLAALEEEGHEQDDPDQGSQDPDDH
jgi:hypothetical protein